MCAGGHLHTAAFPEFSQIALSAHGPVEHGSKRQFVYGSPEYPLGHLEIKNHGNLKKVAWDCCSTIIFMITLQIEIITLQMAVLPLDSHSAFVPQGPVEQGSISQPRLWSNGSPA